MIGPHLLGRRPSPPDARDYQLAPFLALERDADPLQVALAVLQASHAAKATKQWAAIATARIVGGTPAPAPAPAPLPTPPQPSPAGDIIWADTAAILDQGDTVHCVGNGWAQWGNTDPVNDQYTEADASLIYYEAKAIDGEPGQENGSSVRSGAKAMLNRGRLGVYAFAASLGEARDWVRTKGPIVLGTDWYDQMFNPDPDGTVHIGGQVAGGHCYLWVGDRPAMAAAECINSWGPNWADHGRFYVPYADLAKLLADSGEACAALELPVAA